MTILLLTNILTPYRKFFYDKLYEGFNKEGIDFKVLVMAETEPNRNWTYSELKTNYTILLEHKLISVKNLHLHFNRDLKCQILNLKPDIVILAGGYLLPSVFLTVLLSKKIGFKTYFWSESHLSEKRNYHKIILMARDLIRSHIYNKFDGFWYSGKLSKELILKYINGKKDLCFVPNLVNNNLYVRKPVNNTDEIKKIKEEYGIDDENFIFICPARLTHVKGIDTFINLFSKCTNRKKATILIPGDGELKEDLINMIEDKDVNVRLIGYKNQEEMSRLYMMSDFFLMPSLSDANPLTCVEALWSSLPLLVSKHVGNYPEVIRIGENGYVFDYGNEIESIQLIDKIIDSSKSWRKNAGELSFKIAMEIYEPNNVVNNLITKFKGIV